MPAQDGLQSPVASSPESEDSRVACKQNDPENEALSAAVQGIYRTSDVSGSPRLAFPLSGEACSLPLLCSLPTTACCDVCETVQLDECQQLSLWCHRSLE